MNQYIQCFRQNCDIVAVNILITEEEEKKNPRFSSCNSGSSYTQEAVAVEL